MMRFSWSKLAFVVALSVIAMAPLTSASAQVAASLKVDVSLKDADLVTATRTLTQQTGIQFVVEPSDLGFGKITLDVKNVTAEDAIRYICEAAGATFRRDENGVYIIGHEKPKKADEPAPPLPPAPRIVRKIRVLRNQAVDVYKEMVEGIAMASDNPWADLKKFRYIDDQQASGLIGKFQPQLKEGGISNTYQVQPATATNVPLTGSESGSQISLPGESARQIGGGGGGGGIGGGQGGGIGGGQGGGIGGGQGGGQNAVLTPGQGLVPQDISFISYNPTDNSLIVYGTEDAINELQARVNQFDVAPRQVLIKVEFITTTDSITKDIGSEFTYSRGTIAAGSVPGTFVNATDPVFINFATGNLTGRLRTYLTEGKGKVEEAPIVRTLNNEPVFLFSSVTTYIFLNTTVATGSVILNEENPQQLTAATALAVNPRINDDNTITMYLTPSISSFVGSSVSPDGEDIPNQVTQAISVVARVKNGETIVLGGLTTKNDSINVNKFPVLADLPIIGQFFRSENHSGTNSELLIFVTPTIVEDDQSTGGVGP